MRDECKYADICPAYSTIVKNLGIEHDIAANSLDLFGCQDLKKCEKCDVYRMIADKKTSKLDLDKAMKEIDKRRYRRQFKNPREVYV